jgi:hypothetical protein
LEPYLVINVLNVEKSQKYVNMEEIQWMELQLVQNVVDVSMDKKIVI